MGAPMAKDKLEKVFLPCLDKSKPSCFESSISSQRTVKAAEESTRDMKGDKFPLRNDLHEVFCERKKLGADHTCGFLSRAAVRKGLRDLEEPQSQTMHDETLHCVSEKNKHGFTTAS